MISVEQNINSLYLVFQYLKGRLMNWPPEAKVNLRILIDKSQIFKINQAIRVCIIQSFYINRMTKHIKILVPPLAITEHARGID